MKASELKGRAVLILQEAEKIGTVGSIICDINSSRVLGLKVKTGLFSGDRYLRVADIRSVGPDAVTVPDQSRLHDNEDDVPELKGMPDLDDIGGSKVVSESGNLIGSVDDVIVDMQSFVVQGFQLGGTLWDALTGHQKMFNAPAAGVRYGKGLLIVPDEIARQLDARMDAAGAEAEQPAPAQQEVASYSPPATAVVATPDSSSYGEATSYTPPAADYQSSWIDAEAPSGAIQPSGSSSTIYPAAMGDTLAAGEAAATQAGYEGNMGTGMNQGEGTGTLSDAGAEVKPEEPDKASEGRGSW